MPGDKQTSPQPPKPLAATPPWVQSEAFLKHLEHASAVVQTWPEWKQRVLGGPSSQPPAAAKPVPAR